jgi:sensor histidine kinase regulating citrate/malate metabolism
MRTYRPGAERPKAERRESLLTRVITSSLALAGISITVLMIAFLIATGAAFETQLRLRARSLADFVAGQSEFAMLVGDRGQLEIVATNALGGEDVLFVNFTDVSGQRVAGGRTRIHCRHGQRAAL